MTVAGREAHHLVFNGWAIARSDAFDLTRIDRRAGEILPDDGMGSRCGGRDVAGDLPRCDLPGEEREWHGRVIAMLDVKAGPIHGSPVEARRRPRLEPPHGEAKAPESAG